MCLRLAEIAERGMASRGRDFDTPRRQSGRTHTGSVDGPWTVKDKPMAMLQVLSSSAEATSMIKTRGRRQDESRRNAVSAGPGLRG